ncbi:hypothetical protein EDB86DRAFT_318558 [Lactarius hatsudake]|nr:hypothetical protein EDB86DRAFT_318558 [Lactarius hatsudake]
MCSRHLPPSLPLSNVKEHPQSLILLNIRRFPPLFCFFLFFFLKSCPLPILSISQEFGPQQPAACSLRQCSGVWGPSNSTAHAISRRGCSHGRRGTSPNSDVAYYYPRGGGSQSEEPGTLCFRDCASAGHRHNACPIEPKRWRYHAASARRTARHPRVALFLLRLRHSSSSFPFSATAAAARPAATADRSSPR